MGGPVLATPIVDVPPVSPGQTLELGLEVTNDKDQGPATSIVIPDSCNWIEDQIMEANYCLVTPCGQPFGELVGFSVAKEVDRHPPLCGILAAPFSARGLGLVHHALFLSLHFVLEEPSNGSALDAVRTQLCLY